MAPSSPHRRRVVRPFLVACAAIALLAAGAVALVVLATRPGDEGPAGAAAGASPPLASTDPRALDPRAQAPQSVPSPQLAGPRAVSNGGLVTNPRLPPGSAPGAAPAHAGRPDAAAPDLTRAMPSRARSLVSAAIQQQVPAVAACFARRPPGFARRTALDRRSFVSGRGVLRLDLEPAAGELFVADARIELAGNATDAELECARRALRGAALTVDGVAPRAHIAMIAPIP